MLSARLVLFDIDGTLLLTGGAGMRGMNRAFEETFRVKGAFDGIPMPGRTDSIILADALARLSLETAGDALERFRERYYAFLREEIERPGPGKGVLPGVQPLLDALHARPDVFLAVLSGNFSGAARIKLEYFGLDRYFACGAYGEDATDRNALVEIAVGRARSAGAPPVGPRDVIVVGDTPLDVACAVAAGARSVAVATGGYSVDALRRSGAEVVFATFRDTGAFLRVLRE
jgi:phosphoglycolate phosphatase